MAGSPHVPDVLRAGPFRGEQALAAGLTRRQLQSDCWRHLLHDVYAWSGLPDDLGLRTAAAVLVLPSGAAFSHRTGAWLHGVDAVSPGPVPVVTVPSGVVLAARDGLVVRHAPVPPTDVVRRRGLPVTAPGRTAFDLARTEPGAEAVACVDAILHAGLIDHTSLTRYVADRHGWRGVRIARRAVDSADPAAESPMESRLRMVLIDGGLPRPVVNMPLYDPDGAFLGRPDLRIRHVVIEYDGAVHREAGVFGRDLRRQNLSSTRATSCSGTARAMSSVGRARSWRRYGAPWPLPRRRSWPNTRRQSPPHVESTKIGGEVGIAGD